MPSAGSSQRPLVDVCIASYRRPEGLRRLLRSIAEQETGGAFDIAVHVADNDAARSAEPVVAEFVREGFAIRYAVEPEQNIALARNCAMREAAGEYVATIDDDTYADRHWVAELLRAREEHDADVVHGRTVQVFPPGTRASVLALSVRRDPPSGSTSGYIPCTGNSLFKRSLVDGMNEPFDPRLGLSGGEDTQFFLRLSNRGARLVYTREALTFEEVVPERATLRWCVLRRFRAGNAWGDATGATLSRRELLGRIWFTAVLAMSSAYNFVRGLIEPARKAKAKTRSLELLMQVSWLSGWTARRCGYRHLEYRRRARASRGAAS